MLIDFNEMAEITVPGVNGGTGMMSAKMHMRDCGKIISCRIHPGGSIGLHTHESSDDINYVISGSGKAITDGEEELLTGGVCHVCRKGSSHTIENTGDEDLVLVTYEMSSVRAVCCKLKLPKVAKNSVKLFDSTRL